MPVDFLQKALLFVSFWHLFQGAVLFATFPVVYATLRPPATILQPFRLKSLTTVSCPLLTAHRPLPTAHYPLSTAHPSHSCEIDEATFRLG